MVSKVTFQVYKGVTIFYDAASRNISVHNKVSSIDEEIITSNLKFERGDMCTGVPVESYLPDNGIHTSKDFTRNLHGKGHGINNIGVGGHQ